MSIWRVICINQPITLSSCPKNKRLQTEEAKNYPVIIRYSTSPGAAETYISGATVFPKSAIFGDRTGSAAPIKNYEKKSGDGH